jgi:protocatechuate 3,4-dioxygenase beta subunit
VIQPEHLPSADSFVAVAAGRTAVADVRLAPAAAISGRVVDGQGRPVAGAALRAAAAGLEAGPPRGREIALLAWEEGLPLLAPGEAVSGADGSFRLASLEFLPHDVVARGDGHLAAHAWGVPAGTSDLVLALDPGAAVIGRVLDAGGVPIAGARVEARPGRSPEVHRLYDWGNWHEDPGRDQAHDARTPADGRFRIAGLQPGAHELQVTADGRTPVLRQVEIAGDLLDLGDIRLDPELEAAGSVVTAAGVPVPGARVRALRQERSARSANSMSLTSVPPLVETRSDGNGRFVLKGVPAGPFRVSAESDEFAAGEAAGVRGGDPAVKVVLEEGIVIHGRVIDGDRSGPIAGVEIKAGFQGEKRVMSDAGGAFTIRGFAPAGLHRGRVTLRASHPDFSPLWQDLNGLGTTPGKPLEIRLTRAGRIRGRILDAGGLPLAGARVWIEVSGLSRETMGWNPVSGIRAISAADGTYALPPPQSLDNIIGDLAVQVVARHSNLATGRSAPLELPRSGEDWPEVEVTLTAGVGVEGRIVDQGGAPVGRARVAVRRSEGESETLSASSLGSGILDRVGYSGADGRYTVRGLEPGPVVVDVLALGYARQTLAGLEVGGDSAPGASAEILRVDVVLERGGELAGRVIEEGVAPVAGAEVVAFPEDSSADAGPGNRSEFEKRMEKMTLRGRESARTDAGGRFRIQGLRDQTFRAVARAPGYEPAELAGLKPGEDVPDLKLLRFSAIHGRVVAAGTREPVGSFTVDVVNTEKRAAMQKRGGYFDPRLGTEGAVRYADPEGQFTYDGLRPGPYEVTVWAAGFIAASREVAIVTGSEAPIEIELERGGNLQGFVREEGTGAPILGAMVGVYHRMSDPGKADRASYQYGLDSVPSAADGSFIVAGLRDGTYSVSAWHPFYRVTGKQPEATVEGGKGPPELELELAPAGRLEVEVKGLPRGHPRKRSVRCSVALEMVEEGEAEDAKKPRFAQPIHRDSSGLFVAEHLAPGTYRVILKEQEMEAGEAVHLGPMGGFQASVPRGEEKKTPLGEVEVRARETSRFTARKP